MFDKNKMWTSNFNTDPAPYTQNNAKGGKITEKLSIKTNWCTYVVWNLQQ